MSNPEADTPTAGIGVAASGASPPSEDLPPAQGVAELRRRALTFGFGFVTLGIVALLVAIYLQLIGEILWASTLAVLFYPLHRIIVRLVRGRATTAAVISTVLSIAILFIPAVLITFNLVAEVQNLWPSVQESLGPNAYESISEWLEQSRFRGVTHLVLRTQPDTGPAVIEAELHKGAVWVQEFLLERLRSVTKSVPAALVRMGITLVAFFFSCGGVRDGSKPSMTPCRSRRITRGDCSTSRDRP